MTIEYRVNGFFDLMSYVERLDLELWYRGVTNAEYKLIPGAVRTGLVNDKRRELGAVLEFMFNYRRYHEPIDNSWELYSLMQHYGFPTRLLDWTSSPIVACYFATLGEPHVDCFNETKDRVVWAMLKGELNKYNLLRQRIMPMATGMSLRTANYLPSPLRNRQLDVPGYDDEIGEFENNPMALAVPVSNARIFQQKGYFTVHGDNPDDIEKLMNDNGSGDVMFKFLINEDAARSIRKTLKLFDVTDEDMMQDLESLSLRVKKKALRLS